jgi:hypothetical protein
MKKFRIIASNPGDSAFKAQVECRIFFWKYWMDIEDWRWGQKDCEEDIKVYNKESTVVVKKIVYDKK